MIFGAELYVTTVNQDEVHAEPATFMFFNQKKKLAMVGSKKPGKTKTEWEGICVVVRPFHSVHADDGLDTTVSGSVLVQVTVSTGGLPSLPANENS